MFRTSPFDELFNVFRDFDSLFLKTFAELGPAQSDASRLLPGPGSGEAALATSGPGSWPFMARWGFTPAVESFVKDGKLFIRCELPGVDPKDVQVTVTGNRLQFSGEKRLSREVDESNVYVREAAYGRFERAFALPEGVKSDQIKARHENGVLELTMPAPAETESRKVQIEVGSGGGKQPKAA